MTRSFPSLGDISAAVEGRAAVMPTLLWWELGGEGDFSPLWLSYQLSQLGYGPHPGGFWWRQDIPIVHAERYAAFLDELDEAYPDADDEPW